MTRREEFRPRRGLLAIVIVVVTAWAFGGFIGGSGLPLWLALLISGLASPVIWWMAMRIARPFAKRQWTEDDL